MSACIELDWCTWLLGRTEQGVVWGGAGGAYFRILSCSTSCFYSRNVFCREYSSFEDVLYSTNWGIPEQGIEEVTREGGWDRM